MDSRAFDRLAAGFARAASRRGVLAALVALAAGAAADPGSGSARKRHECGPDRPCPSGFDCVKQGRKRRCTCASGIVCAETCCAAGQACEDGRCVTPEPACIPAGEACKDTGRRCCNGRTCASGQGGQGDIACYVPAGGPCATSADCVYGSHCRMGLCSADPIPPAPPRCTVCASGCPHATIASALADESLATITVSAGTYPEHDLEISRSLTLEACGNGPVTIDAAQQGRVVLIPAGSNAVTLRGLILANGVTPSGGGGISNGAGNTLTVDDCTIRDCSTTDNVNDGGGIYNAGALALTSSTVRDCASSDEGGGIYNAPGGSVTISGATTITGNRITDGSGTGGGIYNRNGASVTCSGGLVSVCGNTSGVGADDCRGSDVVSGWRAVSGVCGCCSTGSGG